MLGKSPLKIVARHFMLSLCQLTPLNLEEPLPVGALFRALAFTVTVSPVPPALGTGEGRGRYSLSTSAGVAEQCPVQSMSDGHLVWGTMWWHVVVVPGPYACLKLLGGGGIRSWGGSMCWRKYSGMLSYKDALDVKLRLWSLTACPALSALVVEEPDGYAREAALQEEMRDAGSDGRNVD
ncbi:MAG: hypothetical protein FRX49_11312 [Trebouxia sp. A1-2]|nr:MAG: hypothetical protein FRX49_11312 [Trebouxia sp. A1-2]